MVVLLAIPVILSLLGLFSERFGRFCGVALLRFSLVTFWTSGMMLGLSYLPSSILLLIPPKSSLPIAGKNLDAET